MPMLISKPLHLIRSLQHAIIILFFSFMLLSPGYLQIYKYTGLMLILIWLGAREVTGSYRTVGINKYIFSFSLGYSFLGCLYILYGEINNNPGALYQANAYILYPLFFTFMLRWFSNENVVFLLARAIIYANIIIGVHGLLFVVAGMGVIPHWLALAVGDNSNIGIYDDYMAVALPSLSSLIVTIPFSITILFAPRDLRIKLANGYTLYIAIILPVILSLASMRRALIVAILITPFLILLYSNFGNKNLLHFSKQRIIFYFFPFILVGIIFYLYQDQVNLGQVFESIFNIDNPVKSASNEHKFTQIMLMYEHWLDAPLFGHGHGAVVPGINSSEDTPWAYEASYMLLLHNVGLIGFVFYTSGILWIFFKSIRILREETLLAYVLAGLLIGLTCLLVANATNPYLGKFDSLWAVFFPLAIINIHLLRERSWT